MASGFEGFCPEGIGNQMVTLIGPDEPSNVVGRRPARQIYQEHLNLSTMVYNQLVANGVAPEDAEYVLPRGIIIVAVTDTAVPNDNPLYRDPQFMPTETRAAYDAYTASGGRLSFDQWRSMYQSG